MVAHQSLNPIRPNNGELGDDVQEEVMDAEDGNEADGIENGENENEDRAEDDELRKPHPAARPYTPTKTEVYEHEVTHLPYRTWCKHCVKGRGVSTPHRKGKKEEKIGITISIDYCFMSGEADAEEDLPGILIVWDDNHECLWALPVESKGAVEWVVKYVVEKLDEIGYRGVPISIKSDQEPAILALKTAIAAKRVGVTTPIESPVRESQSNGAVEQAVRRWRGQLRTLKIAYEENMATKLPVTHPLMGWLVLWSGEVLLKYKVRESGRTAYESITGHRVKHPVVMFGETLNFKLKQDEARRRNMESDWSTGIFVGVDPRTSEALIISAEGLFKCRTVRRVIREDAFNPRWVEEAVTPIDEYVQKGAKTSFEEVRTHKHVVESRAPVPEEANRKYEPRRIRLEQKDFDRLGYTQNCRGCEFLSTGIGVRQGHSSQCRARMEKDLAETEDGKARLDKSKGKFDYWTAKAGEEDTKENAEKDKDEDKVAEGEVEMNGDQNMEVASHGPETFDISGSPASDRQNAEQLEDRKAVATDRRMKTPDRAPAVKRRTTVDRESPSKKLFPDRDEMMAEDGGNNMEVQVGSPGASMDMEFESPDPSIAPGRPGSSTDMIALFKGLNIIDIAEVFSPPRVVKQGEKIGLTAGTSMDLLTGWNFELKEDRDRAVKYIRENKPKLVIGSPPCTYFSNLQELNKHNQRFNMEWMARFQDNLEKAIKHIEFCITLYKMQMDEGRYWLHEHPWGAKSWQIPAMEELLKDPRVHVAYADQCQFGLTSKMRTGSDEQGPAKKPTGFIGNSWAIIRRLKRTCDHSHVHVKLEGGRAKAAALYPDELCMEMCKGLKDQIEYDDKGMMCLGEMNIIELDGMLKDMIDIVDEMVEQPSDDEITGSHVDSAPVTDEAARGALPSTRNKATPPPKPISRERRVSWADQTEEEEEVKELRRKIEEDIYKKTRRCIMEMRQSSRQQEEWPSHWKDLVHDEDGGMDMFGRRPQNGVANLKHELAKLAFANGSEWAQDDVSGVELDPELVKKAREVEMTFFRKMEVYTRVPRAMQRMKGGKIIGVRWVDVNKGDAANPDMRSRLVGQEFNTGKNDELYASTPPLEALRFVISSAATFSKSKIQRHVMINDVRRAYFYAKTHRDIYVELPAEDTEGSKDQLGKLNLSLYGTRDAASNWQKHLTKHLEEIGFISGIGHPSVYHHKARGLVTLVHGDDYTTAGEPADLRWMKAELEKAYEIKTQVVGPEGDVTGKVLNRIITYTGHGFELEADPRHAEMIVEQLGVTGPGGVTTAGCQNEEPESPDKEVRLEAGDVTSFRGVSARSMYLGPDRPEMLYASKEVCREMSEPSVGGLDKITRIAKFLHARPRVVWEFPNQERQTSIDVYVDANWAGCRRTRKSTSGGCAMIGSHCIKAWSKTQSIIAKSSAESELYGVIKGSSEALGLATMARDFGEEMTVQVHVDATAAMGIVDRRGISRVRHIECDHLWIQELEARRMMPITKVPGGDNPADLMTKNVGIELAKKHMKVMGIRFEEGRSKAAAKLHHMDEKANDWSVKVEGTQLNIVKIHKGPRRTLYSPSGEDQYPIHSRDLEAVRITYGTTASGKIFEIEDNWKRPGRSERNLEEEWTGYTVFKVKPSARGRLEADIAREEWA